jgi:phosphoribosylamine--glycine ligase
MRVLVVGSGGREHVTVWKFLQSSKVEKLYIADGNDGIGHLAEAEPRLERIPVKDNESLLALVKEKGVDLTFVGPERPLSDGLVDLFSAHGLAIVGPTKEASRLESSKAYGKDVMANLGIPVATYRNFDNPEEAKAYVKAVGYPVVVKADGLAAGKGSIVCSDVDEALQAVDTCMVERKFGDSGDVVVVEKRLYGRELSFFCFTDGATIKPMAWATDYKPVFDNDEGLNTGGMGGYSPNDEVDADLVHKIMDQIALPLVHGFKEHYGIVYKGILYIGLMLVEEGDGYQPYVLEINVRMGDPEAQVIYPRLLTDFVDISTAVVNEELEGLEYEWSDDYYICACVTSGRTKGKKGWYAGYPRRYAIKKPIEGLEELSADTLVFHSGTCWDEERGQFLTDGGRVLSVVIGDPSLEKARHRLYQEIEKIHFEGIHYRKDIGLVKG